MLDKYYCYLPAFTDDPNVNSVEANSSTPKKLLSYIKIPTELSESLQETAEDAMIKEDKVQVQKRESNTSIDYSKSCLLYKLGSETEAAKGTWPHVMKERYHGVQ